MAERTGSTLNFLLGDHLGSTSITTDSSGVKSAEMMYYPWGGQRYAWNTTPTTLLFTGQRVESSFGLYFYNSRWYDPAAGRFVQADTLIPQQQGVQALDRYAYVNNDPVKHTDPTGHCLPNQCGYTHDSDAGYYPKLTDEGKANLHHEDTMISVSLPGNVVASTQSNPYVLSSSFAPYDLFAAGRFINQGLNSIPPGLRILNYNRTGTQSFDVMSENGLVQPGVLDETGEYQGGSAFTSPEQLAEMLNNDAPVYRIPEGTDMGNFQVAETEITGYCRICVIEPREPDQAIREYNALWQPTNYIISNHGLIMGGGSTALDQDMMR